MKTIVRHLPFSLMAGLIVIIFWSCKKSPSEPVDLRIKQMDHEEVRKMAEEIESASNPTLKEGLSMSIWAVDSLIVDPISIDIDEFGTLYYTSSGRLGKVEFDIRGHQDWEIESISLQTIEEKRAFLRKELSPERSEINKWLKDYNNDGSHDWRDMLEIKESVYRVKDTNGDGLADWSQKMVEDFHEEVTDIAAAVLKFEDDLYVGVGPDFWKLKDKNGDGIMDEKVSLSHGYGIHIGFGAHGMSGATVGPDGRIYWAIGDIGFNGIDKTGKQWRYPNRGVVVRANPDGSDFEVFAMGVRNTHEFVFDDYNNLISVDNDGDHRGESERLVYLVNGSDTGWRINWQFGKYRDPDNNTYKVWMDEKLYIPRHEGQAAYITPCIINYVNGPTGMLYNPGTALAPRWKNTFFVVEFVGNPARSGIHAFKLKPSGATFELQETEMIQSGMLPTGIAFGPDGALYAADWINGWGNKNYGRIWKIEDEEGKNWEARKETQRLITLDFSKMTDAELEGHLFYEDQRIRRKAQFELAKRGDKGAVVFERVINQKDNQLARINAIVGLSQVARTKDMKHAKSLIPLLKDSDPEIRAQAAKWLGDIRYKEAGEFLLALLVDEYPRARFFGAEAIGRVGYKPGFPALVALLERNDNEDAYIRHAASYAMASLDEAEQLMALSNHYSKAVRLGAVLALRRMEHPGIKEFLGDNDEYILTEVARAINDDFSIEEALPELGNLLVKTNFSNEPLIRRAINANLRVGTEQAMQNLIVYMLKPDAPLVLRQEAIDALGTWTKPSVLDRVDGRYRGEVKRDGTLVRTAAKDALMQLLAENQEGLRLSAVNAIGRLAIMPAESKLLALVAQDRSASVKTAALQALAKMQSEKTPEAIEKSIADADKSVRVSGLKLLDQLDIDKNLKVSLLMDVIDKRTTEEKQAAILALGKIPVEFSGTAFDRLLDQMGSGKLNQDVLLELTEAVENNAAPSITQKYKEASEKLWKGDALASYQSSLNGGDVILGRRIFFQSQTGQCMRCHAYDDMGGNVGPPMNGIAKKLSRQQLLESLIDPSKRIAPGYGMVTLDLKGDKRAIGILAEENTQTLLVSRGNQPDTLVRKSDVIEMKNAPSSMPDMKGVLSRREIRDLVAYLATLKEDF
ncbi:HEAT repeat domain-containing protein [Cecembia calidifontis]|uniref:Putative membrane-bound dehydrogenase-like protein n=1 Tax=Cecembia calidifontis TaxID=1187080 RepID=A0A4Q7PAK3_9BACT|nr:HEAT repeat domain-containing protein [Cecembia calidifontis]RZS97254.1 putative membrane-bound dehydrogenase-like protein [Cecembia calidifontis]